MFFLSSIKKLGVKFSDLWGRGSDSEEETKSYRDKPPDLDKLWRKFNDRLNRLFKRQKDGGDGNQGDDHSMAGAGMAALVLILFASAVWLVSGTFIVQEGQVGVVMTFGKHTETKIPGISWHWPYPIQTHEVVNVSQVRTIEVGYRSTVKDKQPKEALMLTNDENIIDIQFAVQYRLKDASEWIFNHRNQEDMIRQVAEAAIREVVGKSKMDFVLYEGRDKIAADVNKLMQGVFEQYRAGVQITNVTMQGVQPPEQVQAAFDDAVKAGQDRERQKSEGEAYANDIIPKARGAASRLLHEAEGYRAGVIANAEGDAARFKQVLAAYKLAPQVTRDRMYIETMQQIFSRTTKLRVDATGGNKLLYLPLDKLIEKTTAEEAAAAKQAAPAAAAAPA
ncbi:MAG: FtsH protease activity modulator HflK, partial [Burkholderiaceae bacterium]|nr:FtsH protease activity modulator HflK [Burkholderiaceae bacterium]